jgi:hypothetical protein
MPPAGCRACDSIAAAPAASSLLVYTSRMAVTCCYLLGEQRVHLDLVHSGYVLHVRDKRVEMPDGVVRNADRFRLSLDC